MKAIWANKILIQVNIYVPKISNTDLWDKYVYTRITAILSYMLFFRKYSKYPYQNTCQIHAMLLWNRYTPTCSMCLKIQVYSYQVPSREQIQRLKKNLPLTDWKNLKNQMKLGYDVLENTLVNLWISLKKLRNSGLHCILDKSKGSEKALWLKLRQISSGERFMKRK